MLHSPGKPDHQPVHGESPSVSVANPRRTRLTVDGQPVAGPVTTSGA